MFCSKHPVFSTRSHLKWELTRHSLTVCIATYPDRKFRPEHFTDDYGFITDYLAEFIRELRKEPSGDALDKYYHLGKNLNQRDTIAVRKMVGGFLKLLYPESF